MRILGKVYGLEDIVLDSDERIFFGDHSFPTGIQPLIATGTPSVLYVVELFILGWH